MSSACTVQGLLMITVDSDKKINRVQTCGYTLNEARRYKSLGKIAILGTSVMARIVLCLWCCFSLAFISVHGALQHHSDSDDHEDHMKALSEMNNEFAFRLYKSIVSVAQSQNVFFSPLSVSMALAAVSLGAGGETHQQLLSGLGFNSSVFTSEEMHQAFLDLLLNLNQRTGIDLNVGTAVYVNDTFKPHPEFLEKLKHFYLSDGFSVDFTKSEETSNQMNSYVSEKTHKKIRKFIKGVDSNTFMYLLSYIYFKGKWSIPFDPKNTRKEKFSVDKGMTVPVQMMCETDNFYTYYDQELSTIVLRLDYNDSFSMILALPKDLTVLQEALHPHHIANWNRQMSKSKYEVYLPKLSLKTSYSLINILSGMGMKDMFTVKADFTGITDEEIYVSEAVHKATLDVDEAGATATAVTGIQFSARTGPISLKFNKPFMTFIIDQKTKNILFMGKIVNPKNSEINE
ncbi:plasma serine protease inhibitor-like [Pangasianodon hypophthalmus]|uniref:plasma serine protease inhibitor-like n=1 Tax=Pangasianodon hypophthalmus TaxID=310915 RepID=UPI0023080966|nr:plasma serine protease inhibitor-like [Pangasianodon hypophthalmus]